MCEIIKGIFDTKDKLKIKKSILGLNIPKTNKEYLIKKLCGSDDHRALLNKMIMLAKIREGKQ